MRLRLRPVFIRSLLFVLPVLLPALLRAQTSSGGYYAFATASGVSPAAFSAPTVLLGSGQDDIASALANIGFSFRYGTTSYTQFSVSSNGVIRLGSTAAVTTATNTCGLTGANILPFWDDNTTGSDGYVRYELLNTGAFAAPNRRLVIEYKFNENTSAASASSPATGTVQCWLDETTGKVTFVYGAVAARVQAGGSVGVAFSTSDYVSVSVATASGSTSPCVTTNTAAIAAGTSYSFTPGFCTAPAFQATGFRVGDTSATQASMYWDPSQAYFNGGHLVVAYPSGSITLPVDGTSYAVGSSLGAGKVIYFSNSIYTGAFGYAAYASGLTPNTSYDLYNYTFSGGTGSCLAIAYNTVSAPHFTLVTKPIQTYTWTGTYGNSWAGSLNWAPERRYPDPTDRMVFDGAATPAPGVTGIPTETIQRLSLVNGAAVSVTGANTTQSLTLSSDGDASTDELSIPAGTSLTLTNGYSNTVLTLVCSGTGFTGTIGGTVELSSINFGDSKINFGTATGTTAAVTTVLAGGALKSGGTSANAAFTSNATTLRMFGTYEHRYTTAAGTIPTATWNPGSNCLISGNTSNTAAPGGIAQTFADFTWGCFGQTAAVNLNGSVPTVAGTFRVTSTGSQSLYLAAAAASTLSAANYAQTGGTLGFSTGAGLATMNVPGTFNQTGGTILGGTGATLHFNGTAGQQAVNFHNAAPTDALIYRISNPAGIALTGSGTLTNTFTISSSGGLRLSTNATSPLIATSLTIKYDLSASLIYDYTGNGTCTVQEFPATNGPSSLTVAVGAGNVLTLPLNRTLGGTLTMTSGDLNLGSNVLTLGTSGLNVGTLAYTSGLIRVTTGTFTRWFGTVGLPTTAGNAGLFPLGTSNGLNRSATVYFSSASGSSAGTLTAAHSDVAGFVAVSPALSDAGASIGVRSQSGWTFNTANGLLLSGTASLRLTGANVYTALAQTTNLRTILAASAVGTHSSSTGTVTQPVVTRSGLTTTQLTNTFYIGAPDGDVGYTSVSSGNWGDPATWDRNAVPIVTKPATIGTGTTVTLAGAGGASGYTGAASVLTVTGTLTASDAANALNIAATASTSGATIDAGGQLTLSNGTVTIGTGATRYSTLAANGGLSVSGGTLTLNGNLALNATGTLSQSGGAITIDGNAAGVTGNSVASGTYVMSLVPASGSAISLTGGTLTLVDPHASFSATLYSNLPSPITVTKNHTFVFGDGTSNDAGGAASGFLLSTNGGTSALQFGNVVLSPNTGSNAATRLLQLGNFNANLLAKGSLTIGSGAELRQYADGANMYGFAPCIAVGGNLTVAAGGTLTAAGLVYFGDFSALAAPYGYVTAPATVAQTLTNNGTIRNAASGATAQFTNLRFNNTSAGGVTLASPASAVGTTTFESGLLHTSNTNLFTVVSGGSVAGASSASFVDGPMVKTGNTAFTFPVGKSTSGYHPIAIGTTVNTSDVFKAEYVRSSANALGAVTATGLTRVSSCEYWTLDKTSALPTTTAVTLAWNPTSPCGASGIPGYITDYTTLVAAHFNGTSWDAYGGTPTGSNTTGSVTWNNVSTFSPFALGSTGVGSANPLPVSFLTVTARAETGRNRVEWTTGDEAAVRRYAVQKEHDGAFATLGTVPAVGTGATYAFDDDQPVTGRNTYRIQAVAPDGTLQSSNTVTVLRTALHGFTVAVAPNPTTGALTVRTAGTEAPVQLILTDLAGRPLLTQTAAGGSAARMDLAPLPAGTYLLRWTCDGATGSQRVLKL